MERNHIGNVVLNEGFKQVCVWPATIVGESQIKAFEQFILDELGARVQYLEEVLTAPDKGKYDREIAGTGGRNDVIFAVHTEDVGKFAIPRLSLGIRWIEDVYGNGGGYLYEPRVASYKTW